MERQRLGRKTRQRRMRAKIRGTLKRPRLAVFRSQKYLYAQLIDDKKRETLTSASDLEGEEKKKENRVEASAKEELVKTTRIERARRVGKILAERAGKLGIKRAVFDRRGYKYHGRVRALAEGAREGGLKF